MCSEIRNDMLLCWITIEYVDARVYFWTFRKNPGQRNMKLILYYVDMLHKFLPSWWFYYLPFMILYLFCLYCFYHVLAIQSQYILCLLCTDICTDQSVAWDNYTWRRHQMEIFSALLAICAGYSPAAGEFPARRPMTRSFDVLFDLRLNKRWVNNHEAGHLRRQRAHYDVIVMINLHSRVIPGSSAKHHD